MPDGTGTSASSVVSGGVAVITGSSVGDVDGTFEGDAEGTAVGTAVGVALGTFVGLVVGDGVGASVSPSPTVKVPTFTDALSMSLLAALCATHAMAYHVPLAWSVGGSAGSYFVLPAAHGVAAPRPLHAAWAPSER